MPLIQLEVNNNVAAITLNRPEKFHAFNREMALELQQALDDCAADSGVRAVYLTGSGKAFCSGQDLAEVAGENSTALEKIVREHYNPIIRRLRTLAKPVVCAVNGVAAGAGANIALSGDIVVAAASASFIQAFSKIGLIPDSGGTYTLPRLIGLQKASALMMLGDKISAPEAERMGMIYKVFPEEDFAAESFKLAVTLAGMPTKALAYTKQALNASYHNTLEQQLQLEDELQSAAGKTADYKEGVAAFLQKRMPVFKGL
jgi:2-(1,2-epoxy-1,2-dihydrophenyl)acetyl-CoA isomerase